jgi:hypothetical protein
MEAHAGLAGSLMRAVLFSPISQEIYPLTWMNAPVTMARAVRCGGVGDWHVV